MKMAMPAVLLLAGCAAVYEYPLYDRNDPEIYDKPSITAERRTELLASPGRLAVKVSEKQFRQTVRVRRRTSVERVRRAEVTLDPLAHVAIWTIGWAAGGPIVWYPVLMPSARDKAREAAYTGSRDPGYPPFWSIDVKEIDRKTEEPETVLRTLGPPQVVADAPVAGIDVDVKALNEVLTVRTDAQGVADVPILPLLRRHLKQEGLIPLTIFAGEATLVLDPAAIVGFFAPVDWSSAGSAPRGSASADVDLDGRVVEIALVNNGEGDLTRFWIRVSGQPPVFIGRVKPRQLIKRRIPVGGSEVIVEFFEERGCAPQMKRLAPK
jgi:hypothetical protein